MTKKQKEMLPELMQNYIVSSQMEGLTVSRALQDICLAILNGERTLEDCLYQISAKYNGG